MASILLYKSFDCANGVFKANVYFEKLEGQTGLVIRYNDMNDYYALMLNSKVGDTSIKFIKTTKDSVTTLKELNTIKFEEKVWYTFIMGI